MELINTLLKLIPYIIELVRILKGQPAQVQKEALLLGKEAIKNRCEGVGCPLDTVS